MAGVLGLIWVSREQDSFFAQGWAGQISLKGLRNFLFWRNGRGQIWRHCNLPISQPRGGRRHRSFAHCAPSYLNMKFRREDEGLFISITSDRSDRREKVEHRPCPAR
jgi:hypothetical protein